MVRGSTDKQSREPNVAINDSRIQFSVATHQYKTGVSEEYVIVGNDAIVKCNIPSFVTDFVAVDSWVDSEANDIFPDTDNTGQQRGETPDQNVVLEIYSMTGSHTQA